MKYKILGTFIFIATTIISSCGTKRADTVSVANDSTPVKEIIKYVLVKDTTDSINFANQLDMLTNKYEVDILELNKALDQLKKTNDSLNVQLFNANYKLNKIAEYNRIAAKGNNIKYLRGWINRTLEQ